MNTKNRDRFELRLNPTLDKALKNLAIKRERSAAQVLKDYIESAAKREKVWPQ